MTQVGEGQETAAEAVVPVMTFGAPTVGEILAERYQLEEHVNNDSAGRQVWRGIDVILRRPVAVVLRQSGGNSAEMLQAAVDASRVIHPNLVGVYDAIDEGERSYVVREWVDGQALREIVAEHGPLEPQQATAIARAVTDALAAVHATGMVHGNVHPGTALIGNDGRVVLADARADSADTTETDIRAVGGLLYYALTGQWPHAEAGRSSLPDAIRDANGGIAAPRQVRAGIPAYLDDLAMDLLDKRIATPASEVLAAELARLDSADDGYEDAGPLRFAHGDSGEPVRHNRRIVLGIGALLVVALVGLIFGIKEVADSARPSSGPAAGPNQSVTGQNAGGEPANESPADSAQPPEDSEPKKIKITAGQVRIVDPPDGTRDDEGEAVFTVDDDPGTAWKTQGYRQSNFGNNKPGMGVLIDLREARKVSEIRVEASPSGAKMEIYTGTTAPPNTREGDKQVMQTFKPLSDSGPIEFSGAKKTFPGFEPGVDYRYIMLFVSELPPDPDEAGTFRVSISNIEVWGP